MCDRLNSTYNDSYWDHHHFDDDWDGELHPGTSSTPIVPWCWQLHSHSPHCLAAAYGLGEGDDDDDLHYRDWEDEELHHEEEHHQMLHQELHQKHPEEHHQEHPEKHDGEVVAEVKVEEAQEDVGDVPASD